MTILKERKIKFSLLMSVYKNDSPTHLQEALESIRNQTLQCEDICIVCDGPLTNELEIVLQEYIDKLSIHLIRLKENVGLGEALNTGLKFVKYEWVFRMDSDDICLPDRFELQAEAIDKNQEYDIVGGFIDEFSDDKNKIISRREVPLTHSDIMKCMSTFSPFNHVTVAFKKQSVLRAGSYKGGKNFQEDYYLWLRMANIGCKFTNIPKTLVLVRGGDEMLDRRKGWQYYKNEMFIARQAYNFKIISVIELMFIYCTKFIIRLSPKFVRQFAYKMARKKLSRGYNT